MPRHSPIFVSHGAPTLVLEEHAARRFLMELGRMIPRPEAILAVSAHWETEKPTVSLAERPETIHDFYGFPAELYRIRYPAPGAPEMARRAAELLIKAGLSPETDPNRGLDHGAWAPLALAYPEADIPVAQLSIQPGRDARHHLAVGRALAPLGDEGVLVLGSGGAVHNLRQFAVDRSKAAPWATGFDAWLADQLAAGGGEELVAYAERPEGRLAHPSADHILPLFVALGAGGRRARGRPLHRSFAHGSLSMAAYVFEAV